MYIPNESEVESHNGYFLENETPRKNLKVAYEYPRYRNFVAVWFVAAEDALFTASFHYNEEEGQHYMYDPASDSFLPECDHGFGILTFERLEATFFVAE